MSSSFLSVAVRDECAGGFAGDALAVAVVEAIAAAGGRGRGVVGLKVVVGVQRGFWKASWRW